LRKFEIFNDISSKKKGDFHGSEFETIQNQDKSTAKSGICRLENPSWSSKCFCESLMMDFDRISKWEVLLLRKLNQTFFFSFGNFFLSKNFSEKKIQKLQEKNGKSGKSGEADKILKHF